MNTRTTLFLAVVLAGLVAAFAMRRSSPKPAESVAASPPPTAASVAARDLIEKKLGDVVKVVCQLKGKEAWTFEKKTPTDGGTAAWRMTSPMDTAVASWEVDKFGRELGRLQYEISYKPGEPGAVSPADAGLSPAEATITLTDVSGVSAAVEVGKPVSENETYVRFSGGERVCVGKANLRSLWKPKALEYRDQQLWTFAPENVTQVEIDDLSTPQTPVKYAFAREGAKWMMTSPASARATNKVDDLLRSVSRLRVTQWHDDARDKLPLYGLAPAALTLRVTVEEKVPAKQKEISAETGDEAPQPAEEGPPEIKTTVHELHVSGQSPIGEDAKTYLRVGGESAVATIMKATTDKFKPVMAEWRDMKVTTANIDAATRLELNVVGQRAALAAQDGRWSFEGGGRAEDAAVRDLLKAVKDLNAVVFVEAGSSDEATFGFSQPQAEIKLQLPGTEGLERILVGAYTDESTKRMVYVRRGGAPSIAKVRSTEVESLLRLPAAYRDRTVLELNPAHVRKVALLNPYTSDPGQKGIVAFERAPNGWALTEPVSAAVRADRMDELVESLCALRAVAIVSEEGSPADYGLDAPTATVTLACQPPSEGSDEPAEPEGSSPPATYALSFAERNGKFYALPSNSPRIYEIPADLYQRLFTEYRTAEVLTFDDARVKQFSIRKGDVTHTFLKGEGKWTYAPEPDLPLDTKKVDNLLLQLKDLKTERYVRSAAQDLGAFGLSAAFQEATITLDEGSKKSLRIAQQGSDKEDAKGKYACRGDSQDVFLLTDDMVKRIEVNLADLEKR